MEPMDSPNLSLLSLRQTAAPVPLPCTMFGESGVQLQVPTYSRAHRGPNLAPYNAAAKCNKLGW